MTRVFSSWLLLVAAVGALTPISATAAIWLTVLATLAFALAVHTNWPDLAAPLVILGILYLALSWPLPWPAAMPTTLRLGLSVGIWGLLSTISTAAILLRHE